MAVTNAFREAVNSKDIRLVRIIMEDSLLNDLTFSDFEQMNIEAKNLEGLYDEHDGRELNLENPSIWDDDYMNKLMVQVVRNFSKERVDHLKKVIRKLYPPKQIKVASEKKSKKDNNSHRNSQQRSEKVYYEDNSSDKKFIVGGVAGLVIGGATAAVVGVSTLVGATIGAVVGVVIVKNGGQ